MTPCCLFLMWLKSADCARHGWYSSHPYSPCSHSDLTYYPKMTSKSCKCDSVTPVWETRRKKKVTCEGAFTLPTPLSGQTGRDLSPIDTHTENSKGPKDAPRVHCWLMRYPVLHESFLKKENFTPTFYSHATSPLSTRLSTGHSQIKKQMFGKEEWWKK